jgi:hypothetical protein
MNEKKIDFEIKRLELMIGKIQSQKTVAKASVLSASIQMEGFWWNEAEIEPQILAAALTQQLLNLRKMKRGKQEIHKA